MSQTEADNSVLLHNSGAVLSLSPSQAKYIDALRDKSVSHCSLSCVT